MKKNILILALLFLIECKNNEEKVYFYPNGKVYKIDEFTNNKILKKSRKFDINDKLVSDLTLIKDQYKEILYIEDQKVYGFGKLDSLNRKTGWWKFYNNNVLCGKQEYKIINNQEFINQGYSYNTNGTIDINHTRYIKLKFKKTERPKSYVGILKYRQQLDKKSTVLICIGSGLNKDFSNIDKVKLDTIVFNKKSPREFPLIFETSGKVKIRGFVLERIPENWKDTLKKGPINFIQCYTYFDESIFVN